MAAYCPYCGSELSQETAPGHLPGTALCPTCHQEVDLPGAAPTPEGGASLPLEPAAPPEAAWVPWEGEGGFFPRLFRTIGQVLVHPVRFFSGPVRPGYAWALSFGLILGTLGQALQIFWGHHLGYQYLSLHSALLSLIFAPLTVLFSMFLVAWVTHFCLWVVRGAHNGLRATFRVVAYGQASNVFVLVPYVGLAVMPIWGLVVAIGGLAGAHGIGRWRAFFAIFLPLVVIFFLLLGVVVTAILLGLGSEISGYLHRVPGI